MSEIKKWFENYPKFTCSKHPDEFYKYICIDLRYPQRLYCSDCIAL